VHQSGLNFIHGIWYVSHKNCIK